MKDGRQCFPLKTLIVCITVIILVAIGSLVYAQKQNIAQKDRQAKAQAAQDLKKLKYQECQTNNRQVFGDHSSIGLITNNLGVKNCDLIL